VGLDWQEDPPWSRRIQKQWRNARGGGESWPTEDIEIGRGLWSASGRHYKGGLCVRVSFILDKCKDIIYTSIDEKKQAF
jgi:hypothetical protein